jgi:hypothetical protein
MEPCVYSFRLLLLMITHADNYWSVDNYNYLCPSLLLPPPLARNYTTHWATENHIQK